MERLNFIGWLDIGNQIDELLDLLRWIEDIDEFDDYITRLHSLQNTLTRDDLDGPV